MPMCPHCPSGDDVDSIAVPVTRPDVPLAGPISDAPEGDAGPGGLAAGPPEDLPIGPLPPGPFPPPFVACHLDLRDGCWALSVNLGGRNLVGTLRVDRGTGHLIVSGDLYRDPPPVVDPDVPGVLPAPDGLPRPPGITSTAGAVAAASAAGRLQPFPLVLRIPIYPRANYHSYLEATSVRVPLIARTSAGCRVTMTVQQFLYTQPAPGTFLGSFPATASRTLVFDMTPHSGGPILFPPGPAFSGRVLENGAQVGTVSMRWVSRFFRRAKVEIDVLTGSVAAGPVPDPSGTGTEWFDSVFAKIGWDLTVISDQTNVPVPTGVTPTDCWSNANLHTLMLARRNPAANLDTEWYMHLMFVPAKLGCGRGVMYDIIDVPREGVASFSDDGYPTGDSVNFGVAANKKQRDVPRAFLRSACHEITHGFNQIHQEQETAADNSIMTTTPSVANVLGGPTTGAPGVFPDQINIGHNLTVRNHLVHMPDPVIRPGGWPFAAWFGGSAPQASDRARFDTTELDLTVTAEHDRIVLGEPVPVSWTLTNTSSVALQVPNDVSSEALFATVYVTDPRGVTRASRPVAIVCDHVSLQPLDRRCVPDGIAARLLEHRRFRLRTAWTSHRHRRRPVGGRRTVDRRRRVHRHLGRLPGRRRGQLSRIAVDAPGCRSLGRAGRGRPPHRGDHPYQSRHGRRRRPRRYAGRRDHGNGRRRDRNRCATCAARIRPLAPSRNERSEASDESKEALPVGRRAEWAIEGDAWEVNHRRSHGVADDRLCQLYRRSESRWPGGRLEQYVSCEWTDGAFHAVGAGHRSGYDIHGCWHRRGLTH